MSHQPKSLLIKLRNFPWNKEASSLLPQEEIFCLSFVKEYASLGSLKCSPNVFPLSGALVNYGPGPLQILGDVNRAPSVL